GHDADEFGAAEGGFGPPGRVDGLDDLPDVGSTDEAGPTTCRSVPEDDQGMLLGAEGLVDESIPGRRQGRSGVGVDVGVEAPEYLGIEPDGRRCGHTYIVGDCRRGVSDSADGYDRTTTVETEWWDSDGASSACERRPEGSCPTEARTQRLSRPRIHRRARPVDPL